MLDPADAALKRLAAPVLARELREGSPTSRLALEAGRALLAAGYHQQVPVRTGFLNLFAVVDGQRRALALANGVVEVRGTRERWPVEEALAPPRGGPRARGARARSSARSSRTPCCPPPPTSGGPAEIAYHAQIAPSYAHFGIPRPALLPRPSVTLVEPPQARALDAERLALGDLVGDPEALVSRWAREAYPDVEAAFARRARGDRARAAARSRRPSGAHDPTLRAAAAVGPRARPLTRSTASTRRRCAPSRSATRAGPSACGGRGTRSSPAARCRSAGSASWARSAATASPLAAELGEVLDPFARGHQVVRR